MYCCKYCGTTSPTKTSACSRCFLAAESILIEGAGCANCNSPREEIAVMGCGHWLCFRCFRSINAFTSSCRQCHQDIDHFDICNVEPVQLNSALELSKLYARIQDSMISDETHGKFHRHRQSLILLGEYVKWLTIATPELVPSDAIDDIWQQHILDVTSYLKVCDLVRGRMVDRNIIEANRLAMFTLTIAAYKNKFGLIPAEAEFYWRVSGFNAYTYGGSTPIFVKTPTGTCIELYVDTSNSVYVLKQRIREKLGIPLQQQGLMWAGRKLEEEKTLAYYKIGRECTVHIYLQMRGC